MGDFSASFDRLSAIHHDTPLKVCGDAIYDIDGLVYKGEFDTFWEDADSFTIDKDLYFRYKGYLINEKQINGNFYKPLKTSLLKSGIIWN